MGMEIGVKFNKKARLNCKIVYFKEINDQSESQKL